MNDIIQELDSIEGDIEHVVIERQFVDIMSQITGVLRSFAGKKGVKATLMPPSSWRKKLTGSGKASEDLIKEIVISQYPQMQNASEHEIDCCALFLAWRNSQ